MKVEAKYAWDDLVRINRQTKWAHVFIEKMNQLGRDGVPFLFILDFELKNPVVLPVSEVSTEDIEFQFGGIRHLSPHAPAAKKIHLTYDPPSRPNFEKAFNQVKNEIQAGNTYLLNLCFRIPIQTKHSINDIFAQAVAKYKLRFKDEFTFFSPETFIKITNGSISTFPMKGTIDATLPKARERLLVDPKEDAEHATIVDLMRNDLNRVAEHVRVKRYKYLDKITTDRGALWQMSSEIQGVLPPDYPAHIGEIVAVLLPAGSISGAPKAKTLEIIKRVESHPRGYYTGVAGVFDGRDLDSAVMIRFIENDNGRFFYRSGGGITSMSEPEKEYQELLNKIYIPVKHPALLLETVRLQGGRLFHLDYHERRLNRTQKAIFGESRPLKLKEYLSEIVSGYNFGNQCMRVRILYRKEIETTEFIPYKIKKVETLQLVHLPEEYTNEQVSYKWAGREIFQILLAQKGDADDILIIRDGAVTDTSIANVAFWDGYKWWTPKHPLLKGTARERLLDEGVIAEREICVEDLRKYEKICIFNAMIDFGEIVLPVKKIKPQ